MPQPDRGIAPRRKGAPTKYNYQRATEAVKRADREGRERLEAIVKEFGYDTQTARYLLQRLRQRGLIGVMPDRQTRSHAIRVPDFVWAHAQEMAKEHGTTVSYLVVDYLRRLDREGLNAKTRYVDPDDCPHDVVQSFLDKRKRVCIDCKTDVTNLETPREQLRRRA